MNARKGRRNPYIFFTQVLHVRDVGSSYDYEKTVGEGVYGEVLLSASRRVEAPSRHRRASSPGEDVVAGFFFDFEAIRTESSDRDAPRR